jgi:hypothetical protein
MLPEYPIETGLADFFAVLKEKPKLKQTQPQQKSKPTLLKRI